MYVAIWRGGAQADDLTALGISLILSHHPLSSDIHHQLVRDFMLFEQFFKANFPDMEVFRFEWPSDADINEDFRYTISKGFP
jgi:hypothetical protein